MHVYTLPLVSNGQISGALALFQDVGYIDKQKAALWRGTLARVVVLVFAVAGITLLVIRWIIVRPIQNMAQWIKDLRTGRTAVRPGPITEGVFKPLTQEVTHLAISLRLARASADAEARLREAAESVWTAERLRIFIQGALEGGRLFVVSNREPYKQSYRGKNMEVTVPASGLVSAIEPILRASKGTWLAHGSGDADRVTEDDDRLPVPPGEPRYT